MKPTQAEIISAAVAAMSPEELDALNAQLDAIEASRKRNPLMHFIPTEEQRRVLDMFQKFYELTVFGGNSSGKSEIGAFIAGCYLIGEDPTGRFPSGFIPKPARIFAGQQIYTKIWIGCVNIKKGLSMVKEKLIPKLPESMISRFREHDGLLEMETGASAQLMSYDAPMTSWASDAIDFGWNDEQCPESIYDELRARVARRQGRILNTLTPATGISAWMDKEFIKNRRSNPNIAYTKMSRFKNNYLTPQAHVLLDAAFKGRADERCRNEGDMINATGAIHKSFSRDIHVIKPFPITDVMKYEYQFMRVIDLHPSDQVPCVCQWLMYKRGDEKMIYVIAELEYFGNIRAFANAVKIQTTDLKVPIRVTIIDTPESKSTERTGTSMILEMAKEGLTGIPGDRNEQVAIGRFNDYLETGRILIFGTCENTIESTEDYSYDRWGSNASETRDPKEKPVKKNNHHIRNLHYAVMYLGPASEERRDVENYLRGGKAMRANYSRKAG